MLSETDPVTDSPRVRLGWLRMEIRNQEFDRLKDTSGTGGFSLALWRGPFE